MNSEEFERNKPTTSRPPPPKGQGLSELDSCIHKPNNVKPYEKMDKALKELNESIQKVKIHDYNLAVVVARGVKKYRNAMMDRIEKEYKVILDEMEKQKTELEKENERLKRGDFTKEEFQALCHKLNEEDKNIFCDGCDEYQRKLFGTCQTDELKKENEELEEENDQLNEHM